jgi:hypothetical protein
MGFSMCGDVISKVATSAGNWLKLETDARAIGMGGAYVAMGAGISGVPYNPASIAFVEKQEGFLSQTKYIADITYNVLGYSRNMNEDMNTDFFGIHIFSLDSGPMDVTLDNAESQSGTGETFKFTGLCIRGTYARRLTDRLSIGVTGKYIREQIYTTFMHTYAFDIGSNFNTGLYGFVFGMSISNIGPEAKYQGEGLTDYEIDESGDYELSTEPFPLPMTLRIGITNELIGPESELMPSETHKLLIAVDAINPIDYTLYGTMGMEYAWKDMIFARMGYRIGHDTAKWSVGGGFRVNGDGYKVGLDYAYVNYGILDYTHQFGINFEF